MNKELKTTLRFVFFIATPLCLVNSLIVSFGAIDFWQVWSTLFLRSYIITFPQAVLYVSAIKWFDKQKAKSKKISNNRH